MSAPAIRITAPPAVAPLTRRRRGIAVALLLSLGLHAIVILGLVDWFQDAPDSPSVVKATLTRVSAPPTASPNPAESVPDRPIAQPPNDTPGPSEAAETLLQPPANPVIASEDSITPRKSPDLNLDYADTVRQIANLDANNPGGSLRVRRIVEGRTHTAEDTWYLESWRRKVERIGRLNYPEQARANRLYGSLRLLVAIEPDGTLRDVQVIESSGHQVLDQAAVRIVRLAAPYAPFPPAMRDETDVLEIVRTWQFRKRGDASPA
ncbi:MAG: energy transducer TonB [Gammaproteobacteria bacterium]|nr:energy transducer TonB [Gammaproteobacteria bacterium]